MRKLIVAAGLVLHAVLSAGCGAQARAIEHAEYKCLEADLASLKAKMAAGITSPSATAIALTAGEVTCALEALDAKAASGSAAPAPVDAGS